MHHYITKYVENDVLHVEAWLQINLFGLCFCFSRKKIKIQKDLDIGKENRDQIIVVGSSNEVVAVISGNEIIEKKGFHVIIK